MGAQAIEQVERLALPGSAALAGRRGARVGGFPVGEYSGGVPVVRDAIFRQRPAGGIDFSLCASAKRSLPRYRSQPDKHLTLFRCT